MIAAPRPPHTRHDRPRDWCGASRPSAAACRGIRSDALPTPVAPLAHVARARGLGELWIKRDDSRARSTAATSRASSSGCSARRWRAAARGVITFGGIGTHHGLATAICARDAGMRTVLVLLPQPVTEHVRHMPAPAPRLRLPRCTSPGRWPASSTTALRRSGARAAAPASRSPSSRPAARRRSARSATSTPPSSSPTRCAPALLPEPAAIFVPLGSGGTAAGLVLGCASRDCAARVVGVLVTDILPPSPRRLAALAHGALRRLRRVAPSLPPDADHARRRDHRARLSRRRLRRRRPRRAQRRATTRSPTSKGSRWRPTYTAKTHGGAARPRRAPAVPRSAAAVLEHLQLGRSRPRHCRACRTGASCRRRSIDSLRELKPPKGAKICAKSP